MKAREGLKFCDMAHDLYQARFNHACGVICVLYGIKTPPDALTLGMMMKIFDHSHYLTYNELIFAFELNLMNEYPEFIESYQTLDATFLAKILAAYRRKKPEIILSSPQTSTLPPPRTSDEEFYIGLKNYLKQHKSFPHTWDYPAVYRHMTARGMVDESNEWKKRFMDSVKVKLRKENSTHVWSPETIKSETIKEYVLFKLKQPDNQTEKI